MKERIICPLSLSNEYHYLKIKITHRNIRKLVKIYKEYKTNNLSIRMYKLWLLTKYWKHPYKKLDKYKWASFVWNKYPLKKLEYIYLMMWCCTYNRPRNSKRWMKIIKNISKDNEVLVRYAIKYIDGNECCNDTIPF